MADQIDAILSKYQPSQSADPVDQILNKYSASSEPKESPGLMEQSQASLEGLGNFFSLGQLPAYQAAQQAYLMPDPSKDIDAKLIADSKQRAAENPAYKPMTIVQPDYGDYKTALKEFTDRRGKMADQMPEAYYGGEAAGAGLAGMAVAGPALAQAQAGKQAVTGFLSQPAIKNAVKYGGLIGAYLYGQHK